MQFNNIVETSILGNRYILGSVLGQGGMGIVYRATDRLTGQEVALKRVFTQPQDLVFSSQSEGISAKLALAKEFRLLASLRHPNIISVLDYGFDKERQPFFTMELVTPPVTVLEAGKQKAAAEKLNLIVQILQALAYLHRRGIVHSDLKPTNVLVQQDQARVLDFGLSIPADDVKDEGGTTGTLAYLAPEVLLGSPISKAADLYAVGVIAYQLLTGEHPYDVTNISQLIQQVMHHPVDLAKLTELTPPVQAVLGQLLHKDPVVRYSDANQVIRDLAAAMQQPLPPETEAIRESYLQAAKLVGRDAEMDQLEHYLDFTLDGKGGVLLIGGESGVGKSRLLEELRTVALVRGALVLRGQSVNTGGALFGLWRPVLRWLVLVVDLSNDEAAVLKPLIPDLETLLNRAIPDAPEIDPKQAQARLFAVLEAILRRHAEVNQQPLVIVLEDLQWTSESLNVLTHLITFAHELPLLIIGSYRDDERPNLPAELPGATVMKLERLPETSIAELSESMLGEAGRQPELITLLNRETEGNVFFLIEIVRALAEEVGQLERIAEMDLPANIFVGGMQQIIQRRLDQVPSFARPLLEVAAVIGRDLDPGLLRQFAPQGDLEPWLTLCSNVAVLEMYEERWRFTHHKLRDGLLNTLDSNTLTRLHRTVAEAIETRYPNDPDRLTVLSYHWRMAADPAKSAHYAELAGDQTMNVGLYRQAQTHYRYAIEAVRRLLNDPEAQRKFIDLAIKQSRASAFHLTDEVLRLLEVALQMAEALQDEQRTARVIASTGAYYYMRGDMGQTFQLFSRSMQMAEPLGLDELLVLPYNILGRSMIINGELKKGIHMLRRGIELAYRFNDPEMAIGSEGFLAAVLYYVGEVEEARTLCEACMQHAADTKLTNRIAGNHMLLGFTQILFGDMDFAEGHLREVLNVFQENPEPQLMFMTYGGLGYIHFWRGDLEGAIDHLEKGMAISMERKIVIYLPMFQGWRAEMDLQLGQVEAARQRAEAALDLARKTRQRKAEAEILRVLGKIAAQEGHAEQAEQYFNESITVWDQCEAVTLKERPRLDLAECVYRQGDHGRARDLLQAALATFEQYGMLSFAARARELAAQWEPGV